GERLPIVAAAVVHPAVARCAASEVVATDGGPVADDGVIAVEAAIGGDEYLLRDRPSRKRVLAALKQRIREREWGIAVERHVIERDVYARRGRHITDAEDVVDRCLVPSVGNVGREHAS